MIATARRDLDDVLADAVSAGVVPGAVGLVTTATETLWEGVAGARDAASGAPIEIDTVFRIASMTKALTAVAVLQQVERGLLALDQPVGDVLPAFDELPVLDGFDGDVPILRAPRSRATVRQLLAHSSGLAYDIWNHDLKRYYALTGAPGLQTGLRAAFATPLVSDPGTRFNYGMSMDWAGLLVEELSGRSLDRYWSEEIFGPLGMVDTVVESNGERWARTAPVHARDESRSWAPTPIDFVRGPEVYAGGHCLYSTARDYAALQRLLLGGGADGETRLLSEETVGEIFRNQLGDLDVGTIVSADPFLSVDVPLGTRKWGLGLLLDAVEVPGGRAAWSGGWMGGFNTFFWVDRSRGLSAALYTQTLPFYDDRIMALHDAFEQSVYAANGDAGSGG